MAAPSSVANSGVLPSFSHLIANIESPSVNRGRTNEADLRSSKHVNLATSPSSPSFHAPKVVDRHDSSLERGRVLGGLSHILNPPPEGRPFQPRSPDDGRSPPNANYHPSHLPSDQSSTQCKPATHKPLLLRPKSPLFATFSASLPAHSDLTLAGKPRKRSAQACHRCRDMKIRCRLQDNDCVACLRQGLRCTYEPPKTGLRRRRRSNKSLSETNTQQSLRPPRPIEIATGLPSPATSSEESVHHGFGLSSSPHSARPPTSSSSPRSSTRPSYQHTHQAHITSSPLHQVLPDVTISLDPSVAYPEITLQYIISFFDHLPDSHRLHLPDRDLYIRWIRNKHQKTHIHRMLLYAIMAAGAAHTSRIVSGDERARLLDGSRRLRDVAENALKEVVYRFDEVVVQTQLVLEMMRELER